ncbi:calexcitin-2-like [Littorina saxatilis]|uniref:EF-hand domain-containing protein n=1 Tax=Littorina saxatilis TaxID=31220 RepID=A0AAN9B000_9CAEN
MALTDFQLKKMENVYVNLYDSNKDGIIDQKDFGDAIEKISKLHHWGTNDEQYGKAKKTLGEIWDGLRACADKNKDGVVTLEEWINMWKVTLEDVKAGKPFPDWQQKYMEFMFYANDTSGDGFIDRDEYVTIQTSFGNNKADSNKAFDQLSKGTDGNISKEDFESLWKEYFLSNDASQRGNFLFGLPPQ